MAKRIAVLTSEQIAGEMPRFFEKKSIVRAWIRRAEAVWIVPGAMVQLLLHGEKKVRSLFASSRTFIDGPTGVGNVLPFSKPHSYGDKLHYEMPMAGDGTVFARHRPMRIKASARGRAGRDTLAAMLASVQLRHAQARAAGLSS
jgi:hypothetical protein